MPRRKSEAEIVAILNARCKVVDHAVKTAVGAWQRSWVARNAHKSVTGRTHDQSARRRRQGLSLIGRILDPSDLKEAELEHLKTAAKPLQDAIEMIFAVPDRPAHRPDFRKDGYNVLAVQHKKLRQAGVPSDRAVKFLILRLLSLYPPESNPAWLYELESHQRGNAQRVLIDRLAAFIGEQPTADPGLFSA